MTENISEPLLGKRIIVVEDDYLLARDMCSELRSRGAKILGPAPTPFYAAQLIGSASKTRIDAAVLDIRLHGFEVYDLADELVARRIPFLFATATDRNEIPKRFKHAKVLNKPLDHGALVRNLISALNTPGRVIQPTISSTPLPASTDTNEARFARALARAIGSPVSR